MRPDSAVYRRPPGLAGVELLHLADPAFAFAPHMHDAYVFWFNAHGAERVRIGGVSGILQPDSFGVVAPGETHANHAVTRRRSLESLYVDEAVVADVAAQLELPASRAAFASRLQRDPQARQALMRLHAALMRGTDAFFLRQEFLEAFALLLGRHGEARRPRPLPDAPEKVRLAEAIMREAPGSATGVDELAARCGCTACHLIRLFRRHRGMTPHALLMDLRLSRAKDLLASGTPIADAAARAGFTDQSHLTRRFRARFALTPGTYRAQMTPHD